MGTQPDVSAIADDLHAYATHFFPRDWDYTRDLGSLAEVRYRDGHDRLTARLRSAVKWLFRRDGVRVPVNRFRMALTALRRDRNLPDGVLNDGNIITFWEEDGEYLQYVQPTVGVLIAEWMKAEPASPYAVAVAAEMQRIQDRYAERVARS